MSASLLRKSLELVDESSARGKSAQKPKKVKSQRGTADLEKRNTKALEDLAKTLKKKSQLVKENKKKLKVLRRNVIKDNVAQKILARVGKTDFKGTIPKPKAPEKTLFTEEDFQRFEREYVDN